MANRVDCALAGGSGGGDTDIDRIHAYARTLGKTPLRDAGGRGSTRPRITHDSALGASEGDIVPTFIGRFVKTG
jgi:hypothetical protein